jgi:hypothetical protein
VVLFSASSVFKAMFSDRCWKGGLRLSKTTKLDDPESETTALPEGGKSHDISFCAEFYKHHHWHVWKLLSFRLIDSRLRTNQSWVSFLHYSTTHHVSLSHPHSLSTPYHHNPISTSSSSSSPPTMPNLPISNAPLRSISC